MLAITAALGNFQEARIEKSLAAGLPGHSVEQRHERTEAFAMTSPAWRRSDPKTLGPSSADPTDKLACVPFGDGGIVVRGVAAQLNQNELGLEAF